MNRVTAMTLAAALLFNMTAFADNVVTAQTPANAGSNGPAANTYYAGPTETKAINEKGYLVIGGGNWQYSGVNNGVGPGGGSTAGAASNTQGTTAGTVTSKKPEITPGYSNAVDNQVVTSPGYGTAAQNSSLNGPVQQGAPAAQTSQQVQAPQQTQTAQQAQAAAQQAAAPVKANLNTGVAAPVINGGAALLYDANTNQILFEKNGTKAMFPASTTKLMTALLAAERLSMDDVITFSDAAVNHLESGAVTADMRVGDKMTVKDAMYAMMLRSACEVANGIAEKVAGSQSAFAELMNQRARELGCTGTHFSNASGLNGDDHYTTAQDMALITAAALKNATVRGILQTKNYTLPATGSRGALSISNSNRLLSGGADYYEGIVGGKTGYTSRAGSCLASGIERGGHLLVAVVFHSNTTQYTDTKALYDYGVKALGLGGTAAASQSNTQNTGSTASSGSSAGKWEQTASGWKYKKSSGSYCTNEWLDVNGNTYFFDGNSMMSTGWKQFTNGSWYYFNPENGAMVKGKWVTQNGKSYYLQSNGVMATSTVVDGKYEVNENGVYVKKVG